MISTDGCQNGRARTPPPAFCVRPCATLHCAPEIYVWYMHANWISRWAFAWPTCPGNGRLWCGSNVSDRHNCEQHGTFAYSILVQQLIVHYVHIGHIGPFVNDETTNNSKTQTIDSAYQKCVCMHEIMWLNKSLFPRKSQRLWFRILLINIDLNVCTACA